MGHGTHNIRAPPNWLLFGLMYKRAVFVVKRRHDICVTRWALFHSLLRAFPSFLHRLRGLSRAKCTVAGALGPYPLPSAE